MRAHNIKVDGEDFFASNLPRGRCNQQVHGSTLAYHLGTDDTTLFAKSQSLDARPYVSLAKLVVNRYNWDLWSISKEFDAVSPRNITGGTLLY